MRIMTVFIVVLVAFVCNNEGLSFDSISLTGNSKSKADVYKELFDLIEDKDGLKSIRAIHEQLDNDEIIGQYSIGDSIRALHEQLEDNNDGTIEPSMGCGIFVGIRSKMEGCGWRRKTV